MKSQSMVVEFGKTLAYSNFRQIFKSCQKLLCSLFGFKFVAVFVVNGGHKTYSLINFCQLFPQFLNILGGPEEGEIFTPDLEFEGIGFALCVGAVDSKHTDHIILVIIVLLEVVAEPWRWLVFPLAQSWINAGNFGLHCDRVKTYKLE